MGGPAKMLLRSSLGLKRPPLVVGRGRKSEISDPQCIMVAKKSKDFSITFSPGVEGLFEKLPLEKVFEEVGARYEVGSGHEGTKIAVAGEEEAYQHYHIAVRLKDISNSDNMKRSMLTLFGKLMGGLTDAQQKVSVCVRAHDDINCLVGGYFTKDMIGGIKHYGFTDEELLLGKAKRDAALAARKVRVAVSPSNLMDILKQHMKKMEDIYGDTPKYMNMSEPDRLKLLERYCISEGYDISLALTPTRRKYILENFTEYFYPSKNFLEEFFL